MSLKSHFPTPPPENPTEQLLKDMKYDFYQREDGLFVVKGNIDLSNKNLSSLPDLSQVAVEGYFSCDDNQLTTLIGAPHSVGAGGFWCRNNQLISLIGASQSVRGNVWCDKNYLTSLEGHPCTFSGLYSDLGNFSPNNIPEHLRFSPETRARREQEERQALSDAVHAGTPEPIVLPTTKGIVWKAPTPKKM